MTAKVSNFSGKTANGIAIDLNNKVKTITSFGNISINFEEVSPSTCVLILGGIRFNVPIKEIFKLEKMLNQATSEIRQANVVLTGVPHA